MTEQEKREKVIDEMERDVEEALTVPICDDSGTTYGYRKTTSTPIIAARLISKGYRKVEDVRKEMAKEIFAELRSHCMTSETENCYGDVVVPKSYTWWEDDLNKLEKKFGVEEE